ncbi:MAG: aminotransferase class V-fold PLP-dependent enzyme [Pseudomonadota bacterium]
MDWQKIYDVFPVNREMIWLNNCGTTPAGSHIVAAVTRFIQDYAEKGILTEVSTYPEIRNRIKTILAGLLNCREEELALIHNTAEGMNFISHGVAFLPGDELILLENEYPSNVYPWRHWAERGVRLIFAPMAKTPEVFLESLRARVTEKTRLIALSAVHWCTGMPLPLFAIGALCRERGIDFVVDGAQGVGMQPVDVKKMGISYMSFSAWKWLLGPLGVGVFYIARENLTRLKPIFIGTDSVVREQEYFPYREELKPTADRFTFSTGNWNDWVYFAASLEFLSSLGFETVRERIFELSRRLSRGLTGIGFHVLSDAHPDWPTGIVVCEKEGTPASLILSRLKKKKIVAAERLGRIRFSPHIYISPARIDEVVRVLSAV